ncbi:putative TauD/TfdA-like domain-containing protein [Seiridium cardinale]|uniref:TauD/TfdA-like domain-containing protein n=1 Tax=Seiridium cardinale TaxID=138064 RepID=A0ABR2XY63_9PEZI
MAITTESHSTTGTIMMWNGTTDGDADGWIDWSNGTTNTNPPKDVPIHVSDLRHGEHLPNFQKNGFEFIQHSTSLATDKFVNCDSPQGKALIEDTYFREVADVVKSITGGKVVRTYIFRIREQDMLPELFDTSKISRRTLPVAHLDRDPETSIASIKEIFGDEEAERLFAKYKRHAQVNIWRPIGAPVEKWPLCFIDKSAVPDWSYKTHVARVIPRNDPRTAFNGRTAKSHDSVLKPDPQYKFYYASNMGLDEAFIFSSYDSDINKVTPHGAFWSNSDAPEAPPRRSIEVRSWVFFD